MEQPTRRHGASSKTTDKSGTKRIESAAPASVGSFLEGKGIPISNVETKTSGISVSKQNGKTVIQYHRHGKGDKTNAAKVITKANEALADQGLAATQIGDSDTYVIHKGDTDGLKDLPKPLREKCQRADPGKGGEIKLTKKEVTSLLEKGRVGFISAGKNPASTSTSELGLGEQAIEDRSEQLKKELVAKGLKFVPVKGKYGEEEDSFMVMIPDAKRSEMVTMGRKYNQDSIIYSDHNKNEMIYTTGANTGSRSVGEGFKYLEAKTSDFYSEITTREGDTIKFTLNFDFGVMEKVKKSMRRLLIKSKPGSVKPGHKYTKREGTPGSYIYTYPGEEGEGLFADEPTRVTSETVALAAVTPDPDQPRKHFDQEKLKELGQSIRKLGLVQDIALRPDPDNEGRYIIIAGERRFRAMKLEGIETAPAKIYHAHDPKIITSIQVAENVAREQMNPIEDGTAYKKLIDVGYSLEQVAARVGASTTTVERRIALLNLIDSLQEMVKKGSLPISQAYAIANADLTPAYQQNVIKRLNMGAMSNEALSGLVGKYKSAQSQTVLFGGIESGIDERITKQRKKALERDLQSLVTDFGQLMDRITDKDGIKILPAMAKEKGKLAHMARRVEMITTEMNKLDREMKYALEYFRGGGTIPGYLNERGVKPQRKKRKAKKSVLPRKIKIGAMA